MSVKLALIALFCGACLVEPALSACGYESCPASKPNMINVHLVPHTHDDVGWLKTVDQYYYGSRNDIQHAGVQYILDGVVVELLKNKDRRFIYVESAFFFKWYNDQSEAMKQQVKLLVDEGRLVFAGGAWSMNDEAAVHYQSVIDQFSMGLKALNETFGKCARPTVGWQIDTFGHSREQASLFAQMGFDAEFFTRLDWAERKYRFMQRNGEMIWKASDDLGERSELFTSILLNHYAAPKGFCFDINCSDAPIIDGDSYDNNVDAKVDAFLIYISDMTSNYRSTNVVVPMGDDFSYGNAVMNFKNLDKLIKYCNERQLNGSRINLMYSTPACFIKASHESITLTWPTKTQDFLPYTSDWHTYWTGYYSSRPTQKRFERDGNHFLQVAKQLTTLANLTGTAVDDNLNSLRSIMGMLQHHDAITGTEKQHVASDYARMLTDALLDAEQNTRMALQKLTNIPNGEFKSCLQLNISECQFTQNSADMLVVTLFNPLAHASKQYVRVPVKNGSYIVTDESGRVVPSQVVPIPKELIDLPFRSNKSQHELIFAAIVQKLANFYVKQTHKPDEELVTNNIALPKRFQRRGREEQLEPATNATQQESAADATIIEFSNTKLTFNDLGRLVCVEMNGVTEQIQQDFYYYPGAVGNNEEFMNRSSGAYIFRPNGTEVLVGDKVTLTIVEGPLVKEVHQRFNDWISQVVRIYAGVNRVEFEWLVGPIPIEDDIGKEIITRFSSNIKSQAEFWTDSNGREMLRRVRNERENYTPIIIEAVSSNYYPITSRISLEDSEKRMTLLTDRAQGGTSVQDGTLELMLHRRLLHDDGFGVAEALNETAYGRGLVARGKVYLMLGSQKQKPSVDERIAEKEIHLPYWKFFSNATHAVQQVVPKLPDFTSLPQNIQLLTLEPYTANERLLRLENFMCGKETSSVEFNLRSIFDSLGGVEIRETTLDGNMLLSDMKRLKFTPDGVLVKNMPTTPQYYTAQHVPLAATRADADSKFDVTFDPMQIRTFIVKWQ